MRRLRMFLFCATLAVLVVSCKEQYVTKAETQQPLGGLVQLSQGVYYFETDGACVYLFKGRDAGGLSAIPKTQLSGSC